MGRKITVEATAYGPPWNAMEGTGITSTGVNLQHGKQKLVVAVDPRVIPYGTKLRIPNNPFGNPNLIFTASDTGGAIKGNRLDFFVASGRKQQNRWGRRNTVVEIVGSGSPKDVAILGRPAPVLRSGPVKQTGASGIKPQDGFEEALIGSLMRGGKNPLLRAISAAEYSSGGTPIPEPKKPANYDIPSSPSRQGGPRGSVSVLPGAERPGQRTQPGTLRVARMIAGVYGKPLKIGTTTQHNRLTTTGNVSDHWDGWGADIPSAGQALTRLGQSALIALGMPEAKARKIKGGAHTLKYGKNRRVQVIFNTNIGGNHYNHLHIGVSPV